MNPVLDDYASQFEQVRNDAASTLGRLTPDQRNWNPATGKWSVGQHIAHLIIVGQQFVDSVKPALADARARGLSGSPPYRAGWFWTFMRGHAEPPPRRRFKASRAVTPPPVAAETVLSEFANLENAIAECIRSAEGLDLGRIRIPSPLPMITMNLSQGFILQAAHQRRHLWHCHQVLNDAKLPRA
jgi:DinB superfamily